MQAIIGTLVTLMVLILIGIIVVQSLVTNVSRAGWSAQANSTWTALVSNIWVAFTMLVILPIIVGAVTLLAYVKFGGGK